MGRWAAYHQSPNPEAGQAKGRTPGAPGDPGPREQPGHRRKGRGKAGKQAENGGEKRGGKERRDKQRGEERRETGHMGQRPKH